METDTGPAIPILSERTVANISVLCEVARSNGATLSVKDLLLLASIDITEDQFSRAWQKNDFLSSRYQISSGVVIIRSSKDQAKLEREKKEISDRYQRATSNMAFAERFGTLVSEELFKVLSISGSTSYYSVSKDDDLDFFCITRTGQMWPRFVKALLLARIFRFSIKNSPWLCLSYVADEDFAKSEFSRNRDALFARDAISAKIITGDQTYGALLRENYWMAQYFPKLYSLRVKTMEKTSYPDKPEGSAVVRIANLFLFLTAGTYIRIKSHLLNRRYMKKEKRSSLFRLRIGQDHCIYESAEYIRLRSLYAGIKKQEVAQSSMRLLQ